MINNINQKITNLMDKLDLKKKYPLYFGQHTKVLVRVFFGLLFLYLLYLGVNYGFGQNISVSCPLPNERCFNEYYYEGCTQDYCSKEYLFGGEVLGKPFPKEAFGNFWKLLLGGILLIAITNHYIYMLRMRQKQ